MMDNHTQVPATSASRSIVVDAPIDQAFAMFTEQFDQIKPREHNLLSVEIAETAFERRVGGFLLDRGVDGSECRWARVLEYEPPNRLLLSWDISPRWQLETDPTRTSEVEVRFIPEGTSRTRVRLEHRHLDRHGDNWQALRDGIGGDQGWPVYLERFAALTSTNHGTSTNH